MQAGRFSRKRQHAGGDSGETEKDYVLSYKFLEKIEPKNVRYNILSPYPGSQFYEELAPKGLIDVEDYEDFDVVKTHVTGKGIIKGIDYDLVMKWVRPFRSFMEAGNLRAKSAVIGQGGDTGWKGSWLFCPFPLKCW